MYKSIFLFSISLLALLSQVFGATPPEKIFPLTYAIYSVDYYQEQANHWETALVKRPSNASAWLNYYYAAKNINILARVQKYPLSEIAQEAQAALPATFETKYIQFLESPSESRDYQALLSAYQIAPERWETYPALMAYYEVMGNHSQRRTFAEKAHQSLHLSQGILQWNFNALQSVGENGILLSQGENDTYPAWVLQDVLNVRTDVQVLNIYTLLAEEDYRNHVFEAFGLPQKQFVFNRLPEAEQLKLIVEYVIEYSGRPVYFGIASPPSLRSEWKDELYLTGLTFKHSAQNIDNQLIIRQNYEHNFRITELAKPLIFDPSQSVVNRMNFNYVPSLLLLHQNYTESFEPTKAAAIENLIFDLAELAQKTDEVTRYFDHNEGSSESPINIRKLEKDMQEVGHLIYASAGEVSNGQYQAFLHDLVENHRFEELAICAIQPTDWRSLLPEEYAQYSDQTLYSNGGQPDADDMPIVNISHEAAKIYCQWLTQLYNNSDLKRKKFSKVNFRLPTEEEWIIAAQAGRSSSPYPWGGPYHRNAKGCYLANFNPALDTLIVNKSSDYFDLSEQNSEQVPVRPSILPESPDEDGAYFTVPIDAYFPNDFGLYNMSGNVAEMLDQPNITKGGGWMSHPYFMQIGSRDEEIIPSPNVGFRVFMEVIQE